ncbi:MAG: hypothetical protein EA379_03435 [Phycisphaerales bacterium]|nr:MAG: hypothetical protein EA379_03435 [Phycisphaerales bacterium]
MQVYLDDVPLDAAASTLGDALRVGREQAESRGRIIVDARADGTPIPDDHLASPETATREPYADEIRLFSEAPRALVRAALTDAAQALLEVKTMQSEAAASLQQGRTEEAISELGGALRVWEQVKSAVEQGGMILNEPLDERPSMAGLIDGLRDRLVGLQSALEQRDWAGVSDELAYELGDHADAWRSALLAIAQDLD